MHRGMALFREYVPAPEKDTQHHKHLHAFLSVAELNRRKQQDLQPGIVQ